MRRTRKLAAGSATRQYVANNPQEANGAIEVYFQARRAALLARRARHQPPLPPG